MTATCTFDIFSSLDGFGSYDAPGDWGGYWGKQGEELLAHRLAAYDGDQRMVLGAHTYRAFAETLAASSEGDDVRDPWVERMRALPAAGLVDRVQVKVYPVISGQTGVEPIFGGAADFDLELLQSRTLDTHITELVYRPSLRTWA